MHACMHAINLANFEKMIEMRGFSKVGLALVTRNYVHLLEYPKMRFAAFKAIDTMRKKTGNPTA